MGLVSYIANLSTGKKFELGKGLWNQCLGGDGFGKKITDVKVDTDKFPAWYADEYRNLVRMAIEKFCDKSVVMLINDEDCCFDEFFQYPEIPDWEITATAYTSLFRNPQTIYEYLGVKPDA